MKKIVVIAEYMENKIRPITDELIACALEISAIIGQEEVTGAEVKVLHIKGINPLESEQYKSCLVPILKKINPSFILMGHTSQGIDVAPGLAARLGCICITGVNRILENQKQSEAVSHTKTAANQGNRTDEDAKSAMLFSRSVFKGKLNAVVALEEPELMTLLTIQPGSFSINDQDQMENSDNISNEEWSVVNSDITFHQIEYDHIIQVRSTKSKLDQARVIVAAGRGVVERENIDYIEKLAACFTGSAVAGSRPLVDMGWLPYEKQVGITGAVVSPELYIAVGISGSSQHIAGMKSSKLIVSVNKDPNAAIFNISDICIVEDSINFVQMFIGSYV